MKIIIELSLEKFASGLIEEIYEEYPQKIDKVYKGKREIIFKNGDKLKTISTQRCDVDGRRADVAIGPDADYITCSSKYKKRIWEFSDLDNYLKNI